MRVVGIALLLVGCGPGNPADEGEDPCQHYLDCLAATDNALFEEELGVYGSSGSCFQNSTRETCEMVCEQKRREIGSSDASCEEPPPEEEEETGPELPPAENGKIDCADIPPGSPTVAGTPPGPLGFPTVSCNPRSSGAGEWTCCSDDPAAIGGALPAYEGKAIDGATPFFAELNNSLGTSGMCVRTADIPTGSGLLNPLNCPIPCDPTWPAESVTPVCGSNRVCCQTLELQPEDCFLGEDGQWRPVHGTDIGKGTMWANAEHATHQDPGGSGCTTFAGGETGTDAWIDCVENLSVASRRGYCMALQPGQACPNADPGYFDACEQINLGLIPPPR